MDAVDLTAFPENVRFFLQWLNDAASEKDPHDRLALAVGTALAEFHYFVTHIATSMDYGAYDGWDAIARLYSEDEMQILSQNDSENGITDENDE